MLRSVFTFLLWVCLPGVALAASNEFILYNGKVFTAEPEHPYAEAVAVLDDKIVAVGNRAEVSKAVTAAAAAIDLKGNFLMPGLIDSHCHAVDGGLDLISATMEEHQTGIDQLAALIAVARKSGSGMRGDVLVIHGLNLIYWSRNEELNALLNSQPYADLPVLLEGLDGHTGWANRTLLKRAGITQQMIRGLDTVAQGYYGFGPGFEPTGFVVDAGLDKVFEVIPAPGPEKMVAAGRAAVRYMHELGITAWLDPAVTDAILASYRTLAENGELNSHVGALPVVAFKQGHPDEQLSAALERREQFKTVPDVKIVGIKVFADGVAEFPSQTAAFSKPYRNSGRNGELLFRPADFARIAIAADKLGMIVHVHAIGDQAITEALNGIAAARKANGDSGLPHTITHLQFIRPEDIPRFRELGVIASFQLYWASAEPDTVELIKPYLDPGLYAWQYPARSVLDDGGTIAGASDWPVTTANVFQAIYQAETRRGPEGVLDDSQRVPREAMLYAYTRNAARALRLEDKIGTITPGKQADFALLDRDVLTVTAEQARDTKVLWTIVGGKTVYGAKP